MCTDTYDSYYCHCRTGYEVVNDPYSCPSDKKKRKKRELEGQVDEVMSRVKRQALSCGVDIVFVLDSSGSIRDNNPSDGSYDNWDLMVEFVYDVTNRLDFSDTRVGLIMFANDGQVQWQLYEYSDKNSVLNRIDDLKNRYLGGWTNTPDALRKMQDDMFQSWNGDRSDVTNLAIVITDGVSNPPDWSPYNMYTAADTLPFAQEAKDKGIEIISVGVTSNVNVDEVRGMSSPPQQLDLNYYLVTDFTDLANRVNDLAVCDVVDGGSSSSGNIYCRNTPDGTMCWCVSNSQPVNGTTCRDINECNTGNGGCEDGCVNTDGSYYCWCRSGLRMGLNNMECEDVNECSDTSICNAFGGSCVNTFGGYYCINNVNQAVHEQLVGEEIATVSASSNVATTTGLIIAVTCSAVNLVILAFVAYRWARRREQRRRHDDGDMSSVTSSSQQPRSTGIFRAEAGTVRSFNSLAAKFGSPDAYNEDISRSTSLT